MKIRNASVYTSYGNFEQLDVLIHDGMIQAVTPKDGLKNIEDDVTVDGTGMYLIPGLTDIHFHGCVGYDFCDGTEEAIEAMARYQARNGVTTICPATMTYPEEKLTEICRAARAYNEREDVKRIGASLVGIHMEGPFISHTKKGAQNPNYIQKPDVDMYRRLQQESGGLIKLVDIAPEVEGAMPFIQAVYSEVAVSLAHTAADYNTAMEAFGNGARHVTHLFNAMDPYSHRAPGVIGAAADSPGAEVELICDGIHIHPAVVRSSLRLYGPDRVILVSDSMEATGMPDGEYSLGGQPVHVKGNRATLADGTIAGSATNLMQCLRVMVQDMGLPLETAVRCAAVNPAKSIGIYDRYGSIAPGKVANLVLLNQDLEVMTVILNGEEYQG
ncbi:MAG: N-acetylglucosamine-6-phosphate deacetylase [Lachnospiraceae bacterium]|nr:N-acetylglucosamine-6-phosphate deacetylase [Lachnospiraceae bacterium]